MKNIIPGLFLFIIIMTACSPTKEPIQKPIRLVTLDPGHFHAALVQKSMYPSVDSTVYIYSEGGPDLDMHLARIKITTRVLIILLIGTWCNIPVLTIYKNGN